MPFRRNAPTVCRRRRVDAESIDARSFASLRRRLQSLIDGQASLLRPLVRKVPQILLHQRPVFLRVFLGLGLEDRGAVAAREAREGSGAGGAAALAVGPA